MGGSTEHIGFAQSREDCVDLVISRRPAANGASYPTDNSTGCFAEFGMISVDSEDVQPPGSRDGGRGACAGFNGSVVEAVIQGTPWPIVWGDISAGQIQDGGSDMYDGGNRITTSLCTSHVAPYTDDMTQVASDCFGAGGSYRMDIRTSMMVLLAQNTGDSELTFSISGNLGADGSGNHVASQFTVGTLTGYRTSV